MKCNVCPRNCNVDRETTVGFCGCNQEIIINLVMKHVWEEPIISGTKGSGVIFFGGCNLKCMYCQNQKISHLDKEEAQKIEFKCEKDIKIEEGKAFKTDILGLCEVYRQVENLGVHNINLVTPSHYTNEIIQSLKVYKPSIPIVWNTSSYEKPCELEKLRGFVEIFLADYKYFDENLALEFSQARDYPSVCLEAIKKMREISPKDELESGILKRGLIIRHLVLPTCTKDSKNILESICKNFGTSTIISIMSQYLPYGEALNHKLLNRKISKLEYKIVLKTAENLGFLNIFSQDYTSADEKFIPKF